MTEHEIDPVPDPDESEDSQDESSGLPAEVAIDPSPEAGLGGEAHHGTHDAEDM